VVIVVDGSIVLGGGIAGIQAALDLAESGIKTYLIERTPSLGGKMAQLDKTFPTNDCAMCILSPKLVEASRHPNIELMVNSEIVDVSGTKGDFKVKVLQHARYVDEEKCTGCGLCSEKCPKKVPNTFEQKMTSRRAIYIPFPQAVPLKYSIDHDNCLFFTRGKCRICEKVCPAGAPDFEQQDETVDLNVHSIIISTGFNITQPEKLGNYGYGTYPNVITSLEFERLLSASGPTGGEIRRPSDNKVPASVGFIQCVGSRDNSIGHPYCSSVCCMLSIKEAIIAKEHNPDLHTQIFFMDMRAFGKEFDEYYMKAEKEHKIIFTRNNRISGLTENPDNRNIDLIYIDEGQMIQKEFDLVILSVGMDVSEDVKKLSEKMKIDLNSFNFCDTETFSPLATSNDGIYVCGAFSGPKDIPDSVAQSSGAASKAIEAISENSSSEETFKYIEGKEYPEERDIGGEEPRIGAFICHCGINIGGVVKVPEIVEYVKSLPNVEYAEENTYTCSQDTQEHIKEKVEELKLNRIVVAACTPRTHEPLFQNTLRESGLNPYLFEMSNIRDQCSWVHMHEPDKATEKAKDLVRMAVAKAQLIEPLTTTTVEMTPVAMIVGGGISGMQAALDLSAFGFETHLIEKTGELGGILRNLHFTIDGSDIQSYLKKTIEAVHNSDKINIHMNSEVVDVTGYIGNFNTTINENGNDISISHGVAIIATGGEQYTPEEYLFGKDERVITQLEFEKRLGEEKDLPGSVVMIQCVGCRNDERPYCSRVCCSEAIKNAIKFKELNPENEIFILFKDMRTYGFRELYYEKAAGKGVTFVRFNDERPPEITNENGLKVNIHDHFINDKIEIEPDMVVLSTATLPNKDNEKLNKLFKVPLSKDKFFLEAHMKLRPLDFATDGIFLAGLAHSPKFIEECLAQASGTAARAATLLSKHTLETEGVVSQVDKDMCIGCKMCENVCAYGAIKVDPEDIVSKVTAALCKGCGTCAASCPNRAITLKHFTKPQLLSQISAALKVMEEG
jgi:heterodisulfide reductase subunit A